MVQPFTSHTLKIGGIFIAFAVHLSSGHGRLIEPPSRASAWRYGFDTPHNYNDHELYCGGFSRQWQRNEGKCGICGDAWDLKPPRPHEFGGTYGQGVIVRKYRSGQVATIRVELTANHFGYFEFSVCPQYKTATQGCLDKHRLRIVRPQEGGTQFRYYPRDGNRVYEMQFRVPADVVCKHCLLQWRYVAGNNWGMCDNGTGAVGCGPQEEFRACADVKISPATSETQLSDDDDDFENNEINDDNETTTEAAHYKPNTSLIITIVSFLVICLVLFLIFFHFYQIGGRLKRWMVSQTCNFPLRKEKSSPTVNDECQGEVHDIVLKAPV